MEDYLFTLKLVRVWFKTPWTRH